MKLLAIALAAGLAGSNVAAWSVRTVGTSVLRRAESQATAPAQHGRLFRRKISGCWKDRTVTPGNSRIKSWTRWGSPTDPQ